MTVCPHFFYQADTVPPLLCDPSDEQLTLLLCEPPDEHCSHPLAMQAYEYGARLIKDNNTAP